MTSNYKTFEDLTSNASSYLIRKLNRSQGTAKHYHCLWRKVQRYMSKYSIKQFTAAVGKQYLLDKFGDINYTEIQKFDKDLIKAVNVLSEFCSKGSITPIKEITTFTGSIGEVMVEYLSYRISLRLNKHTVEENERQLYQFLKYLNVQRIYSLRRIKEIHILKYIKTIDPKFSTLIHHSLLSIRRFLKYCYEHNLLTSDLSALMPNDNFKRQPRLPSVYSPQEIKKIIKAVDRSTPAGKRNYAIVLLAARLGLRASDIENLKFENLNWNNSFILIDQYKTGKRIELPILSEVGNAIIDYLKYGRPKSTERFIFLVAQAPYHPVRPGAITGIVHQYFVKSGVNIRYRKHGPHALRHSLAGILLEKGTILPVISEVLGHESTVSTRYYLRIDLKSMNKCSLEVPPVADAFYQQKGGYFYA